ncbi:MAG: hypothetical protein KKA32_12850 [Actinobacteria bacterium]|nr:hypothetical protein [Actinomycetota bacterium]
MADKKVERNVRSSDQDRPSTPTQKMTGALSDGGTLNVAEAAHDRGKGALLDRFRERDERFRLAQSMSDKATQSSARPGEAEASAEEGDEVEETP